MKLTKLSLAAILAAGALSSVSAAPLEEAIKDIDVSGFGRYRFDTTKVNHKDDPNIEKSNSSAHRFTLDVNFKATLDDNFFSVIGLRYDAFDRTGSHKQAKVGLTNDPNVSTANNNPKEGLTVRQYYVGFTGIQDTTVLFGRQPAGTFFTADVVATGLKVANTSIPGVTLAGVYYTNFEIDGDMANLGSIIGPAYRSGVSGLPFNPAAGDMANIWQKNLWGVAAIGSFDWFSFQAWYAGLHRVASLFAVEVAANFAVTDDVNVRGKVQYAGTKLTKGFIHGYKLDGALNYDPKADSLVKSSSFVGVDVGVDAFGLSADVGAAFYGQKDKYSVHTLEDEGGLVKAGEDLLDYTGFYGKHSVFFAKALYTYDAYSAGVDFVYDKVKNNTDKEYKKVRSTEWVARLGYKYNSKLKFDAWYSFINNKKTDADGKSLKRSRDHFRFQAQYNF